jgi:RNA polymerase sigma-70 factor (ECF subfamily)
MRKRSTDAELIERAREGDQRAVSALYRRHAGKIRAQIHRQMPQRLRRRLGISDVLQETFAIAFDKLDEFEGPHDESFRRWLARIAELRVQQHARNHLDVAKRAAGREQPRELRGSTAQLVGGQASPSEHAIAGETAARIDRALEHLSEDHRRILRLVHDEGMSVADAAARMGRTSEAARKLYGRAVARLAERMNDDG